MAHLGSNIILNFAEQELERVLRILIIDCLAKDRSMMGHPEWFDNIKGRDKRDTRCLM